MTSSLSKYLENLARDETATITYESGFDGDLKLAGEAYNKFADATATATTWQTTLQAGATVSFSFDPGSKLSEAAQAYATQSLALWSGMCGINFVYTADSEKADLVFVKAGNTYAEREWGPGTYATTLATRPAEGEGLLQATRAVISLDAGPDDNGFDYAQSAGIGISTLVHEVGHLLGLGHTGAYLTAEGAKEPNNSTDNRAWSVMSYFQPGEKSGFDFGMGGETARAPYTPMGLDIFAAQRLYGDPTSRMFDGNETFGFHSNVQYTGTDGKDHLLSMYDFTVNTAPVVTLFDTGTKNTLDLSGFNDNAIVNLNAGSFSSVAGLSGNIFIEYGTRIDALITGKGDDTITANANGDTIDGGGGNNIVVFAGLAKNYALSRTGEVVTVTKGETTSLLTNIKTLQFDDGTVETAEVACFLRGTRIRTPAGEVAVEALREGDLVRTLSGADRPVVWVGMGRTLVSPANRCDVAPVIIRAGALADGVPVRDLHITRHHAVLAAGALVPVEHLVNDLSVVWDTTARVIEYYHLELDAHDILFADGAPAESFRDDNSARLFQNLDSRPAGLPAQAPCQPIVAEGAALDRAWAEIAARAGHLPASGDLWTRDVDLHLLVDGVRVDPISLVGPRVYFALPPASHRIAIMSRTGIPAVCGDGADVRRLGVAVSGIAVLRDGMRHELPLAEADFDRGFTAHAGGYRWTKGMASLPDGVLAGIPGIGGTAGAGQTRLELHIIAAPRVRVPTATPVHDDDAPDLHLLVDGLRLDAMYRSADQYRFVLQAGSRDIVIASRSVVPAQAGTGADRRRLGVALTHLALHGPGVTGTIALAELARADGFDADETTHRWTHGAARLPAQVFAGATGRFEIHIAIARGLRYATAAVRDPAMVRQAAL